MRELISGKFVNGENFEYDLTLLPISDYIIDGSMQLDELVKQIVDIEKHTFSI